LGNGPADKLKLRRGTKDHGNYPQSAGFLGKSLKNGRGGEIRILFTPSCNFTRNTRKTNGINSYIDLIRIVPNEGGKHKETLNDTFGGGKWEEFSEAILTQIKNKYHDAFRPST
jgi:hypothetical protein